MGISDSNLVKSMIFGYQKFKLSKVKVILTFNYLVSSSVFGGY